MKCKMVVLVRGTVFSSVQFSANFRDCYVIVDLKLRSTIKVYKKCSKIVNNWAPNLNY